MEVMEIGSHIKDLTGLKFGRLTVISRAEDYIDPKGNKTICWLCKCECGKTVVTRGGRLKSGHTKSCGCMKHAPEPFIGGAIKHGLRNTRIYTIWCSMKRRCYAATSQNYYKYGGRGIDICDEWINDPVAFYTWSINNGYADDLSIDRIDNDKGYSPGNCRWTTNDVQARNKRNNHYLIFNGKSMTIKDYSTLVNICEKTIRRNLRKGLTPDEIYQKLRA